MTERADEIVVGSAVAGEESDVNQRSGLQVPGQVEDITRSAPE